MAHTLITMENANKMFTGKMFRINDTFTLFPDEGTNLVIKIGYEPGYSIIAINRKGGDEIVEKRVFTKAEHIDDTLIETYDSTSKEGQYHLRKLGEAGL